MSTSERTSSNITEAELKLLQTLIYQECGMYFDERRAHFLQDRLQRRLRACRARLFYAYYRLLTSREGKAGTGRAARKPDRQRNQLLPQQARNSISSRRRFSKKCCTASRRAATGPCASGARAAPPGRSLTPWPCWWPTRWPTTICAIPFRSNMPLAQAADSAAVARGDSGHRHQLFRAARRAGRHLQRAPDVSRWTTATACAISTRWADRYAIKKAVKEMVHFDFHNLKTEYPAATQRLDLLPQRHDVLRRSRAEATDREVLPLPESRMDISSWATPKACSA